MPQLIERLMSLFVRRPSVEDEDARLARLAAEVMPRPEELRKLRTKLPPSTINYDEEGEQPY